MGSFDTGNFGNDAALDFIDDLIETGNLDVLHEAFEFVLDLTEDDFLETHECQETLAAAEVIALALGNPCENLPEELAEWMEGTTLKSKEILRQKAIGACRRVREQSELRDLWEETEEFDAWLAVLDDLIDNRLVP